MKYVAAMLVDLTEFCPDWQTKRMKNVIKLEVTYHIGYKNFVHYRLHIPESNIFGELLW